MCKVCFDAAELVKQYRGERGIVEGEPCPKCLKLGVQNPVYFYRDIGKSKGRGRCFSCYHIEKNKPTSKPDEVIELPNGDKVYEGKKCSTCQTKLRIYDAETGERLGLTGKAKTGKCYKCARMKQSALEPIAAHRDFLNDVKKAVWKFNIRSVEQSGYVEVVARDTAERAQIKQLIATAMMMNRHAEMADRPERYEIDHIYPAAGKGDVRGMTNIDNLRIIRREDNRSKKDTVPQKYQDSQVLYIRDFHKIQSYYEISKTLKRWIDESEQSSDYTPERKAAWEKKQAEQKAEIEAIESRLGDDFCKAVYAAIDEEKTSLFDVLTAAQSKLRRFKTGGNQKLVENYRKRLALHGERGFVTVKKPDLEAMAYLNKGAVLWVVEATVSNVLDAITLMIEKGMTPEEQRMIDAITYDCIGWALQAMDSKGEVMPFVSPLLSVFGEKIFTTLKQGEHCYLAVYANNAKGRAQKMLDEGSLKPFDNDPIGELIVSASDADVLDRMSLFENETLSIQRQKEAAANARAEAIGNTKKKAGELHKAAGGVLELLNNEWSKLVDDAQSTLLDGVSDAEERALIMGVFTENRKPPFDREADKQRAFMAMCREFIRVPFSDPKEAKECYQTLAMKQPPAYIPSIAQDDRPLTLEEQEQQEQERERLRAIADRMDKEAAEKMEQRKAEQAERQRKAAFMRSAEGQKWLAERNQPNRAGVKNLVYRGVSRDNR